MTHHSKVIAHQIVWREHLLETTRHKKGYLGWCYVDTVVTAKKTQK